MENIKKRRNELKITQKQIAEAIGISQNYYSAIENGKGRLYAELLEQIATALKTTITYLAGETDDPTPAFNNRDEPRSPQAELVEPSLRPLNPHHRTVVKVLPKDFAACCGSGVDWGTGAIDFDYEYVDPDPELTRFSPVIAMFVQGDSMEPYISDGDVVIFTENPSDIEYTPNGDIVVVNYYGRMIVRGLFRQPNMIILKAWNKEYDNIEIKPGDDFRICGRVLRVDKSSRPRSML